MSESLIRAQEIRTLIADWQIRELGYSPTQKICQSIGELASFDPQAGVMVAEGIANPSVRINALVKAGESTGNIAPLIDAIEIAQSETIPEPSRGRKLEFIAYHALQWKDVTLAVDIARDIEGVAPRARVLLAVAIQENDSVLLKEVNQLSADHKLGPSIDRSLMWRGKNIEQYRVGVDAANREHIRQARARSGISEEEAQFRNTKYVADCLVNAFDNGDIRSLIPIADEAAEAMAVVTDLNQKRLEGKTTRYINYSFSIADVDKLAITFTFSAPDASKALYKVIKKIADNNIKHITKNKAKQQSSPGKFNPDVNSLGLGLLDPEELTVALESFSEFEVT